MHRFPTDSGKFLKYYRSSTNSHNFYSRHHKYRGGGKNSYKNGT